MITAQAVIQKKRDRETLTSSEISTFLRGYMSLQIADYQVAAWLMAVYLNGMTTDETLTLTREMRDSGTVLNLSSIPGKKIDKHNTGGVGDKTSMMVAPIAAACGVTVPMITGRALGHTGGTLDKLESIPGFNAKPSPERIIEILKNTGAVIMGQTDDLAPADRRVYALRDVTATVESIPLISASILSKKLAEGIDGLVLDVKTGSGALMKSFEQARELAARMVGIGTACGKRVQELITDMSQPLGRAVGNALEVIEAIETLRGRGPCDLVEVCRELTARMFLLGDLEGSLEAGRARFDAVLASGRALDSFARVIAEQGGDPRVTEDYSRLPAARHVDSVVARADGYIAGLE